jgi:hypothetical protein
MADGRRAHYFLVGHVPMAVDLVGRVVPETRQPSRRPPEVNDDCYVSTTFMGLDNNWARSDPILFETMIFGGPFDERQGRYRTSDEAERGHAEAVKEACKSIAQVEAMGRNVGAKDG